MKNKKITMDLLRILIVLLALILSSLPASALARPPAQGGNGGLLVNGALADLKVTPGKIYVHQMLISSGSGAPAMDITVEARGFGESPMGAFLPLTADEDRSPYSARAYITQIDQPAFHLDPGGSMQVAATINVPADIGPDTHYAIIYIHSQPVDQGSGVSQVLANSVPVVLTPDGAALNRTGEITDLKVSAVEAGKPIEITTTVQNTGNRHFKVTGLAILKNSDGKVVGSLPIPLTATSIIPTFSQQLRVTYSALDQAQGLAPGKYTVEVQVKQEDGSLVGKRKAAFEISTPYSFCPGVDPSQMVVMNYKDQEPGQVNANDKTNVDITFENTGKVTGVVAICKYTTEPAVKPSFSSSLDVGGTGKTALQYVTVRVEGFNQGTARLAVHYKPNELGSVNPNSLFLAFSDNQSWRKLENLMVQTGAETVIGDQPVAALQNGPLIALGGDNGQRGSGSLNIWLVIGLIGLAVVIILTIGLALATARSRRNPPASQLKLGQSRK